MLRSNQETLEGVYFRRLNDDQLRDIHSASLDILEKVGTRVQDEEALELLRSNGAKITDGDLVKIPPSLVEWALDKVPSRITLWDQVKEDRLKLERKNVYYGTGSDCLNILDHRTGKRRRAVLDDVVDAVKVCDTLPNIDFIMSVVLPSDISAENSYTEQMKKMLLLSNKPVAFVTDTLKDTIRCVELAEVKAGGADALRHNPFIILYDQPVNPLLHNSESVKKLLYMAEKGLPCMYIPGVKPGMTAPVTWPGAMAYSNAGTLTGVVLSQLKREGTPLVCRGGAMGTSDLRTAIFAYGAPGGRGFEPELARFYGIPCFGLAGCSDAKIVDGQAVMETALTLLADSLAGANLVHDLGYLESGLTGSLELLVICNEIIDWIGRYMRGLNINEENLAFDVIAEQGSKGNYVAEEHTLKHFKEEWYPELSDRESFQNWTAAGETTLQDRAKDKLEKILKEHTPPEIDEDIKKKILEME